MSPLSCREKTCLRGFGPGPTQTWLIGKTKALISCICKKQVSQVMMLLIKNVENLLVTIENTNVVDNQDQQQLAWDNFSNCVSSNCNGKC